MIVAKLYLSPRGICLHCSPYQIELSRSRPSQHDFRGWVQAHWSGNNGGVSLRVFAWRIGVYLWTKARDR